MFFKEIHIQLLFSYDEVGKKTISLVSSIIIGSLYLLPKMDFEAL